jgi:hypothetical protein
MLYTEKRQRLSLTLHGVVKAITPISVSRPDDNFKSITADDKKPRLPRMGAKREDVSPFIPGSSFRGAIRRCGRDVIARHLDRKFTVDELYMLTGGVDTTKLTSSEVVAGEIDKESELREANPMLSLYGRWGLPSHIGVGDLIPQNANCIFTAGAGVRTNEFIRNPAATQLISRDEHDYLKSILASDTESSSEIRGINTAIKSLLKDLRNAESAEAKIQINEEIKQYESKIKGIKDNKVGAENTIQRPLSGFEAIIPGTELNQRLSLMLVSQDELGLFLESFAAFARKPIIGGHANYACGAVSATYDVKFWDENDDKPTTVATISFDEDGFDITGPCAEELYAVRKQFLSRLKDNAFDFSQYLINP